MLKIINNFFDDRDPLIWIKDYGVPQPQDYNGSLVVEVTTEQPTIKETLNAANDLPWHHDKGYLTEVHSHVAIYCVQADNAGAIQFCDMAAAYKDAPDHLKIQELCKHSVKKFFDQYPNHPCSFESPAIERLYKRSHSYHNLIHNDEYFFFSEAYTESSIRDELIEHCFQDKYITTHEYKTGDLILYDNMRMCHRRDGTVNGKKQLLRFALNNVTFN
jgi:alpha-ketoglutarate-dependent taurine dioxygenase